MIWQDEVKMLVKPGKILVYAEKKTEDLMAHYIERMERDVACLKCALKNEHFDAMRILGHKMKYSGDCYGFTGISEIGTALEDASKKRNLKLSHELLEMLLSYMEDMVVDCS